MPLTEQEKERIQAEERYRSQVRSKLSVTPLRKTLRWIMGALTLLMFLGGFFLELRHGVDSAFVTGVMYAGLPAIFLGLLFVNRSV